VNAAGRLKPRGLPNNRPAAAHQRLASPRSGGEDDPPCGVVYKATYYFLGSSDRAAARTPTEGYRYSESAFYVAKLRSSARPEVDSNDVEVHLVEAVSEVHTLP
jgi:hypothetical protein